MMANRYTAIDCQVFPGTLHVGLGLSIKSLTRHINKTEGFELVGDDDPLEPGDGFVFARTYLLPNGSAAVLFAEGYRRHGKPKVLAVLAHELLHAVVHQLNIAGVPFAEASEEAHAYLLGFYLERVIENLKLER